MIEVSTNRQNRNDTKNKNIIIDNSRRKRNSSSNNRHIHAFKDDYNKSLNEHMHKV